MIIVTIFRWWYNEQFYFSFPLLIIQSNILEILSEIKRQVFVSVTLKAFKIAAAPESSYDRETIGVRFTWRPSAQGFAAE